LAQVIDRIDEGTAIRNDEREHYEILMGEHDFAIGACTEAINLISNLKGGASFIQLKTKI